MILYKYAILNPGRKKKQTFFSLLCIAASSFIILADFALINGMEESLKEAINRVMSGQITVYSSDKENINILEAQLTEQRAFQWGDSDNAQFGTEFPELNINQRIRIGSLISYEEETSYANLHALEASHLDRINAMLTFRYGRMATKDNEIVISESVATDIKCEVGDTVLLVANNLFDYMSDATGVVSGIFEERGIAVFLNYNGFMPLAAGKVLAGANEDESLELVINPEEERDLTVKETGEINRWFDSHHPGLRLATWDKTAPLLHSIAQVWHGGSMIIQVMFILFSIIILITLTSLVIRTRKKEFGTLLAIGFSWRKISLLVCAEYAFICTISVLAGYGLLEFLLAFACPDGVAINSKDMQSALMTDMLHPFVYTKDLLYVWMLFLATTLVSTLFSLKRLQKQKIYSLINE